MSFKFAKDFYNIKNPEKYIGTKKPLYRSSWEMTFMMFCDNNPAIEQWASEPMRIPYKDPLTGKSTVYVPDFLISYVDKNQKKHVELIEIKPKNQTMIEHVGKNIFNQTQYVKNQAKWSSANAYCKNLGIKFRIISASDIYQSVGKRK
jgi:hypothetical protein